MANKSTSICKMAGAATGMTFEADLRQRPGNTRFPVPGLTPVAPPSNSRQRPGMAKGGIMKKSRGKRKARSY